MKHLTVLLGITLIVGSSMLFAQDRLLPRSSFLANVEYARFGNNDTSKYVELYFAFFPELMTFDKNDDHYLGFIGLETTVTDNKTGDAIVERRSLLPLRVRDTADAAFKNTIVTQVGFIIPIGEYTLRIVAVDSLQSNRRDSLTLSLVVDGITPGVRSSDIELCSTIRRSQNSNDPFYKNAHEVVPNPTMLFGAANYPVIFHYLEVYGLDTEETYIVKTQITDLAGKPIQESSKKRKFGVENALEVGTTNVTKLASGKYRFQIYILSPSSQPLARTEKSFYVYNPEASMPPLDDRRINETELSGLTPEELDEEFRQAQYVATTEDIKTYPKISSLEGKREFLAGFWSSVERGKTGHLPITRQDYLLRVERANQKYRVHSRPGWRTDRGRVFILYADPDEVERRPSSEGGKPYEIWTYYRIENGVTFVFVDRTGFGEYVLVHSTKRDELRDDEWRRLLQ